jgi:hypothetical protein
MLATRLWHGGALAVYRASAIPCMLATGALGVWLAAQMRAKGTSTLARLAVIVLCVANPLTLPALKWGHPEDLLGAALCVAAVLCALRERPIWAAVLLGMAVANKEWAILAVGPVLMALPRNRIRTLILSGCVGAALMAPFILSTLTAASGGFVAQARAVGTETGAIFHPWQVWWFLGSTPHAQPGHLFIMDPAHVYRIAPTWVGGIGHTLVIALMPLLTGLLALVRRRRRRTGAGRHDAFLLLALLLALRCMLDPWDISYYSVPFLLALLAWEVRASQRAPVVSIGAMLVTCFTLQNSLAFDSQAVIFLLTSVPALIALGFALYAPGLGQRLLAPARRALVPPAPAAVSG